MKKIKKIKFVKELNVQKERKDGFNLVDMHLHTRASDGTIRIKDLLDTCNKKNIGVGITDHNSIKGAVKAHELNLKRKNKILLIPGIEVTTNNSKDLLFYFYDITELKEFYKLVKKTKRDNLGFNMNKTTLNMEELFDEANKYNQFCALPHPFCNKVKKSYEYFKENKQFLKKINAIETYNGLLSNTSNKKAQEWNQILKKPATAGSDAHRLNDVGDVLVKANADNMEDFIEEIKNGNSTIIVKNTNLLKHIRAQFEVLKNNTIIRLPTHPPHLMKKK
ncbi:PHP domain-containing protein [Candidatus Woesearchaeota archaeon]|jgi:predicted metal-dependent phosphoesterase TrpH|nr:PHP domain-containing protein [Candidatus Woesearchaeota archaeon]MBT7367882.1 PHP domain-containing protein [Candidatus Woesearchaeota archaeon]